MREKIKSNSNFYSLQSSENCVSGLSADSLFAENFSLNTSMTVKSNPIKSLECHISSRTENPELTVEQKAPVSNQKKQHQQMRTVEEVSDPTQKKFKPDEKEEMTLTISTIRSESL